MKYKINEISYFNDGYYNIIPYKIENNIQNKMIRYQINSDLIFIICFYYSKNNLFNAILYFNKNYLNKQSIYYINYNNEIFTFSIKGN